MEPSVTTSRSEEQELSRFEFGRNWRGFLSVLDDQRISAAEDSLRALLEMPDLTGRTFLDIGSGSGLFSLASRRLGARVHSIDSDPESVACTTELRARYFPADPQWRIEKASVLDRAYLNTLEPFDVVYAWGVLHHTGRMWEALDNVMPLVRVGGLLCLAIYNDLGGQSRRWKQIKAFYDRVPRFLKFLMVAGYATACEARSALIHMIRRENPLPFRQWAIRKSERGMSPWFDYVDWVGGYPFEVAKPEEIFRFYRERNFVLTNLTTYSRGHACNEYVFRRLP